MSGKEFPRTVKDEALERCEGRCEVCRFAPVQVYHHRWRRKGEDANTLANCVACCHVCHTRIHDNIAWAMEQDWLAHAPPVNMGLKKR